MVSPHQFFHATRETDLLRFIAELKGRSCVVLEPPFRRHVALRLRDRDPPARVRLCELGRIGTFVARHERVRDFFVLTMADELRITAELAARFPDRRFFGVANDVFPYLISSRRRHFAASHGHEPVAPAHRYALVCTPRSGSSFLCDALRNAGLGAPKEHLRPPLLHFMRRMDPRAFDFERFLGRLYLADGSPAVFGTKIISHFLFRLAENLGRGEADLLRGLGFRLVYLYREDKVLQAISGVAARQLDRWHAFSAETVEEVRDRFIDYDFDRILERYRVLMDEERRLAAAVGGLGGGLALSYEAELDRDVDGTVARVADFIGCRGPKPPGEAVPLRQKLRNELSEAYAERFCEDYRRRFGEEVERLFAYRPTAAPRRLDAA